MRNFSKRSVLCIPALVVTLFYSPVLCAQNIEKIYIKEVKITTHKEKTTLSFHLSDYAEPTSVIQLSDPSRLLIELDRKNIFYDQQKLKVKGGMVRSIRFELKKSALRSKEVEYIAVDITEPFTHTFSTKKDEWRIVFKPRFADYFKAEPLKTIKGDLDLKEALTIARANHVQAQIAREKIELARMRKWEALRALFPALTAKYEQTRGESRGEQALSNVLYKFKEKFLSLQISQPLYQGGRLKATYDQARINLKIEEFKYNKISQELEFEVRKAFMNVVKFQLDISLFNKVLGDLKKDLRVSKKLYKQHLKTKVEYLNVQSKYQHVKYNLASTRKDLEIAKSQLLALLNLDISELSPVVPVRSYSKLDIVLEKLLHQMRLHLPDLQITELELKLAELGRKIGHSGKDFKVDLSGSVGRSASHYDVETLEWKNDFSGGVKISKAFGGNTVGTSYLYDDTSAKLGQSTRTLSKTGSAQISLLDNLKSLSDAKESDIALRESSQKLIEEKRSAIIEVKKNFYNYQKSVIQIEGLREEVKLNKEEVIVTRQKKELNMAQLSELVDAKVKLANSSSAVHEALAFYHIALAGINKSIGLANYYKAKK